MDSNNTYKLQSTGRKCLNYLQNEPTLSLLCGGIAGALSRTAVSPMERLKILLQVQDTNNNKQGYNKKGIFKTIIQLWKEEGYKGLYRGNGINCIRIIPYTATQYSCYQETKKYFLNKSGNEKLTIIENLISGTIGGIMSVLITYPMDLTKTRLSVQTAKNLGNLSKNNTTTTSSSPPGIFKSMYLIYKNEGGFKALYRGLWPTTLGVAPYTAINFTIYESIKSKFSNEIQINPFFKLILGAVSGGIGQTLIYPFDILRRRFQVQTLGGYGSMGFNYTGTLDALSKIIKYEGFKGLYKGWTVNLWKMMPSMAVQWTSYDLIKEFITKL